MLFYLDSAFGVLITRLEAAHDVYQDVEGCLNFLYETAFKNKLGLAKFDASGNPRTVDGLCNTLLKDLVPSRHRYFLGLDILLLPPRTCKSNTK